MQVLFCGDQTPRTDPPTQVSFQRSSYTGSPMQVPLHKTPYKGCCTGPRKQALLHRSPRRCACFAHRSGPRVPMHRSVCTGFATQVPPAHRSLDTGVLVQIPLHTSLSRASCTRPFAQVRARRSCKYPFAGPLTQVLLHEVSYTNSVAQIAHRRSSHRGYRASCTNPVGAGPCTQVLLQSFLHTGHFTQVSLHWPLAQVHAHRSMPRDRRKVSQGRPKQDRTRSTETDSVPNKRI